MASNKSPGMSFSGQEPSSTAGSISQPDNAVGSVSSSSDKDAIANQSLGTSLTPQTQAQTQDASLQKTSTSTNPKRAIWSVYDVNKPVPATPTEDECDATTAEAEDYFRTGSHSGNYETDRGDESLSRYYVEKGNSRVSRVVQKKGDGEGWLRF